MSFQLVAAARSITNFTSSRSICYNTKSICRSIVQQQHHQQYRTLSSCTFKNVLRQQQQQLVIRSKNATTTKCTQSKSFSSTTTSTTTTSTSPSLLEGDIGTLGTKVHHTLQKGLAILAPIYFLVLPDSYTTLHQTIGLLLSTSISTHAYIGLNYVCRDYVPKISSKLLGPARIITAAFTFIMFVGLSKIAVYSPGGIKGVVLGLWSVQPTSSKKKPVEF